MPAPLEIKATGKGLLYLNTTGQQNTATGFAASYSHTNGYNSAHGAGALNSNTTGLWNTASGSYSCTIAYLAV